MSEILGYDFPEDLYYHREHSWARLEEDGTVTVGVTDFTQKAAGEIAYIDMPMEGDEAEAGGTLAKIQTAKWVGKMFSPVSGEIVAVNEDLADEPAKINEAPYECWVAKIQPSDWEGDKAALLKVGDPAFMEWLQGEIARVEKEKAGS